jgi:hypothetical protein
MAVGIDTRIWELHKLHDHQIMVNVANVWHKSRWNYKLPHTFDIKIDESTKMYVTYLGKEKVLEGPFCWTQIYLMMVIDLWWLLRGHILKS